MKNCPNCGAVVDFKENKCAYCGTSYYDLSFIPVNKPFWLKLNVGTEEQPQIIEQRVYMREITVTHDIDSRAYSDIGRSLHILRTIPSSVTYEMTFEAVYSAWDE